MFPIGITRYWKDPSPSLTVMILTLPSRAALVDRLLASLDAQKAPGVEVLVNLDEKTKSVGAKRQECLEAASGRYVAFLDDDDMVGPTYVADLLKATGHDADVITFWQLARLDAGNPFLVHFSAQHQANEQCRRVSGLHQNIRRRPFHMCAWRADIAKRHAFADKSWGEDWDWCERVLRDVRTETHIARVLHFYEYDRNVSECQSKA